VNHVEVFVWKRYQFIRTGAMIGEGIRSRGGGGAFTSNGCDDAGWRRCEPPPKAATGHYTFVTIIVVNIL
jgi:hypothetical protein